MAESRIAQFATSPLLANFAITASQKAIRPVGQFIAPICEVPDLTFRYKKYTEQNRYRVPNTRRMPGGKATSLGFKADDLSATLIPNALDFPIPNAGNLSDEGLQFAMIEGIGALADTSALALEYEIVSMAKAAALASSLVMAADFADETVDPVAALEDQIISVAKAAKNAAPIRILFGTTKFKQFRNNGNVKRRYIVAASRGESVGIVSPQIQDVPGLFVEKVEAELSMMVVDKSAPGQAEDIQFLLDDVVIVFACNAAPNRMDMSFMKTFARHGDLFKAGSYTSEDERETTMKMDWTTLPTLTNTVAVGALK